MPGISSGIISISIHAPREGSDTDTWRFLALLEISIHAPREGSDSNAFVQQIAANGFQSTLPARGATRNAGPAVRAEDISIHAPREGSDPLEGLSSYLLGDFNPRSPRGERRRIPGGFWRCWRFQSTLPARGATLSGRPRSRCAWISIHAPREGSDDRYSLLPVRGFQFQSTLPARGAT